VQKNRKWEIENRRGEGRFGEGRNETVDHNSLSGELSKVKP
jgi:hypothetical protein